MTMQLSAAAVRASGTAFQRQMNGLLNTRFELKPLGGRAYDGEIMQCHVSDRLRLADIRFTPHSTRLLPGRASATRANTFLVSWQIEGKSIVRQGGREAEIEAGELFFIDTSRPFEIETQDIWTRSVYLDSQFWQEFFPERECFTAVGLRCGSGMGRLCTEIIDQLFPAIGRHPQEIVVRMANSLVNLLAISMLTTVDQPVSVASRDELSLERLKAVARDNLGNPDFDCRALAGAVGMSIRHVHELFARTGETPMRWIWRERLTRIARDLVNPALSGKSVSALAFEWGFSDAAHFSRSFKARFKAAPTQYRRMATARLNGQASV